MSTATDLARRYFERFEERDLDGLVALMHPDIVEDFVVLRVLRGREEVRGHFERLFQAFPNFELHLVALHGDDTRATVQWVARGSFTGTHFEGIRPTNQRIELRGVDVMAFRDGLLHRNTIYYDGAAFARQVGLLPAEGSTPEKMLLRTFNKVHELRHRLKL